MDFVWTVSVELFNSNHYPTFVDFAVSVPSLPLPRWSLGKANWETYSAKTSVLNAILLVEDHLEAYRAFENLIYTSASESIPTTNPSKGSSPDPWWDDRYKALRRTVTKCYLRYRETNKIIYNRAVPKKKKYFKEAK